MGGASTVGLMVREIWHRKLNFLLAVLAVTAAVALFVAMLTMGRASQRETTRLMRDLGFNLLILPKGMDMNRFWVMDFGDFEMPEQYVHDLASSPKVEADHFVAMLQKRITWRGHPVLLTGVLPELGSIGKRKKSPMGLALEPGTAYVGFGLAGALGLRKGETIEMLGKRFTIRRCLREKGNQDDIRIFAHLHDVQQAVGKPGRINAIKALGCLCTGWTLAQLRAEVARVLPGAQVSEARVLATARADTRRMVEQHVGFIVVAALVICATWVGVLAMVNVRDRRQEIGILRALGLGTSPIAALFLGKAIVIGLVGALVGYAVGTWLALQFGPDIFKVTARAIRPMVGLLVWSLVIAPVVAALASFLPTMVAVTQDPAVTLTEV